MILVRFSVMRCALERDNLLLWEARIDGDTGPGMRDGLEGSVSV